MSRQAQSDGATVTAGRPPRRPLVKVRRAKVAQARTASRGSNRQHVPGTAAIANEPGNRRGRRRRVANGRDPVARPAASGSCKAADKRRSTRAS